MKESERNVWDKKQNIATEIKYSFDGLIDRLDMAEARNSEVEDISIESSETKGWRKKLEVKNNKQKK